ncbi:uncharacterized protein L199_000792 [Kwoniella botswanensis]|uniref:uncharacterized protein n=1 Tax=Kwoniella botswanensis TaxID=1268659 RepID=UPI00315D9727
MTSASAYSRWVRLFLLSLIQVSESSTIESYTHSTSPVDLPALSYSTTVRWTHTNSMSDTTLPSTSTTGWSIDILDSSDISILTEVTTITSTAPTMLISETVWEKSEVSQPPASCSSSAESPKLSSTTTTEPPAQTSSQAEDENREKVDELIEKAKNGCNEYFGCFAIILGFDKVRLEVSQWEPITGPNYWSVKLDNSAQDYSWKSFKILIDGDGDQGLIDKAICDFSIRPADKDKFVALIATNSAPYFKLDGANEEYITFKGQSCHLT